MMMMNDAAYVSASEGSNHHKLPPRLHPQRCACSCVHRSVVYIDTNKISEHTDKVWKYIHHLIDTWEWGVLWSHDPVVKGWGWGLQVQ